ncbi:MAG: tyrosine-type recombinase/integrase [Saprospiraceae bacterium]|nr:tyrosine-type recombinase/integrase [Saprospiraceae bacterium]
MIPVHNHLKAYEERLILLNSPVKTRISYLTILRKYLQYCNDQSIEDPFTDPAVKQYLLYRYSQKMDWKTINMDYSSIKKYFVEVLQKAWNTPMFPRPKVNKELPNVISKEEVQKLISHVRNLKYKALFIFLYATGMRISEALAVKVKDIDSDRLQIKIDKGKGHKDRYVDVPMELIEILRQYYKIYRPTDRLFYGETTQDALPERNIQHAMKRAKEKAGIIHDVSPHTLRHCYATHHMEHGTNIVYIQKMLGHTNLKTTSIYLHLCVNFQSQSIIHPITTIQISLMGHSQT